MDPSSYRSCQPHLRSLGLEVKFSQAADPQVFVGKVPLCFMEKESNEVRRGRPSVIRPVVEVRLLKPPYSGHLLNYSFSDWFYNSIPFCFPFCFLSIIAHQEYLREQIEVNLVVSFKLFGGEKLSYYSMMGNVYFFFCFVSVTPLNW